MNFVLPQKLSDEKDIIPMPKEGSSRVTWLLIARPWTTQLRAMPVKNDEERMLMVGESIKTPDVFVCMWVYEYRCMSLLGI